MDAPGIGDVLSAHIVRERYKIRLSLDKILAIRNVLIAWVPYEKEWRFRAVEHVTGRGNELGIYPHERRRNDVHIDMPELNIIADVVPDLIHESTIDAVRMATHRLGYPMARVQTALDRAANGVI